MEENYFSSPSIQLCKLPPGHGDGAGGAGGTGGDGDGGDGDPFTISGTGWPSSLPNDQYQEAQVNGVGTASGGWTTKSMGGSTFSGDAIITDNGENDGIAGIQIALTPSLLIGYANIVSGVSVGSFSGISGSSISLISGV